MKAVLVTTKFRGVFFGYVDDFPDVPGSMVLKNARNCIYWSTDCKGFLGLAATGPTSSCRIGPQVEEILLYGITSVTPVVGSAVTKWEMAPWS